MRTDHHRDIEYVVRAHPYRHGWRISIDPVQLTLDPTGIVLAADVLHHHAITLDVDTDHWHPAALDDALTRAGYTRVDPWDHRTRTNSVTAWTQVIDSSMCAPIVELAA